MYVISLEPKVATCHVFSMSTQHPKACQAEAKKGNMLKRTCVPTPPNRLRFALDDALSAVKAACAAFSAPCIKEAKIRIIEIEHVGKG